MPARTPLPIDAFLPEVAARLREGPNLVLVAEPGAGKTTRVPPALVAGGGAGGGAGLMSPEHPAVVMLQPRRVAARAAAERIAEENGWRVGDEIGYHVRFERRIGPATRIRVLTEAILSRQLLSDPELTGVGAVLLDEFHERSVHSDLALALLREVQLSLRPDLRIVVMSATLDAGPVAEFLGGCPVLNVPGRVFPVEVEYRTPRGGRIEELAAAAIDDAILKDDGDILCFLPGAEEIRRTGRLVSDRVRDSAAGDSAGGDVVVLPLHGTLPFDEQRRAVVPDPQGRRKVVLATNIAETSLTIDGVRVVVDSGLSRQTSFDPRRGLEKLSLGRISKASATQRAGRAGRTAAGKCVRLWSAREQAELRDFDPPELERIDLAPTLLTLLSWGVRDVSAGGFGWFSPPAAERIETGIRLLEMLGAAESVPLAPGSGPAGGAGHDPNEVPVAAARRELTITALGRRMATLPLHPRLARLLVDASDSGRAREGATIAAMLAEKDFRLREREATYRDRRPSEIADSDLTPRIELLEYAEKRGFHPSLESEGIDAAVARQVARTRQELLSRMPAPVRRETADDLVLAAFPDRVCLRRDGDGTTGLMVGGVGIVLAPECAVRRGELFLALDAREDERTGARQATVSLAHAVTLDDLRRAFPHAIRKGSAGLYDAAKDKVVGRVETRFFDLVVESSDDARLDDGPAAEALADAILPRLDELITRDEHAAQLLARVKLAAEHVKPPEGREWPGTPWERFRDDLVGGLRGKRKLGEFSAPEFLRSLLAWPLDRLLDEKVPDKFEVPTGNRIRIDYTATPPVLAVRLQEVFGSTRTPSVCDGRVPLVLHLLSPGYKPVQVTQDLVSFWNSTYAQVRKDLRARYPKHSWPEDPWKAEPVAKGRPSR